MHRTRQRGTHLLLQRLAMPPLLLLLRWKAAQLAMAVRLQMQRLRMQRMVQAGDAVAVAVAVAVAGDAVAVSVVVVVTAVSSQSWTYPAVRMMKTIFYRLPQPPMCPSPMQSPATPRLCSTQRPRLRLAALLLPTSTAMATVLTAR